MICFFKSIIDKRVINLKMIKTFPLIFFLNPSTSLALEVNRDITRKNVTVHSSDVQYAACNEGSKETLL